MISVHNPYSPGCVDHSVISYRSYWQNRDFVYCSPKFGQLILTKLVATRCDILRPKCTQFDFGWGCAPDPTGGAYSTPPDPLGDGEGACCPPPLAKNPTFHSWAFRPQTLALRVSTRCSHAFSLPTLACLRTVLCCIVYHSCAQWNARTSDRQLLV